MSGRPAYTKAFLILLIQAFVAKHKRIPYLREFDSKYGLKARATYQRYFGSTNKAIREAGFETRAAQSLGETLYSDEEVLVSFRALCNHMGTFPTWDEVDSSRSLPSSWLYLKRFGNMYSTIRKCGIRYNHVRLALMLLCIHSAEFLLSLSDRIRERWTDQY